MPAWKFFITVAETGLFSSLTVVYNINEQVYIDLDCSYDMIALQGNLEVTYNLNYNVFSDLEIIYLIREEVHSDVVIPYHLKYNVFGNLQALYSIRMMVYGSITIGPWALPLITKDLDVLYRLIGPIFGDLEVSYAIFDHPVYTDLEVGYSMRVVSDLIVSYKMITEPKSDLTTVYSMVTTVLSDLQVRYKLLDINPVYGDLKVVYVMDDPTSETVVTVLEASVEGTLIELDSISIDCDEDSYCFSLQAQVSTQNDWLACSPGSELDVNLNGEIFRFIIDSRNRVREFGNATYSIEGRSISAKLGEGYAQPITTTWDTATTAMTIVQELCDAAGILFESQVDDWPIPASRASSEGEYPNQIIARIADATGAILQTKPDGTLVMRYKYPVSPTQYDSITPDAYLTDLVDMFSVSESREVMPGYNSVVVTDQDYQASQKWTIKEISRDDIAGAVVLAVITYPFVDVVNLQTSNDPSQVSITYEGIVEEEVTETVEIVSGQASLASPAFDIISWSYPYTDLGTPYTEGSELYTEIVGQSLIQITYRTKWHQFRCTNTELGEVQFFTEE